MEHVDCLAHDTATPEAAPQRRRWPPLPALPARACYPRRPCRVRHHRPARLRLRPGQHDAQAEEGQSLAVQMRKLERWAMQRGVTLDGVHVEAGISAGIPFNERPEGGRLWAELRKGDALVAAKLDRMFRSAGDCLAVIETFKARGVSLFLLDLNGGADDVSGNGIARLFLTIVSAFAEFERDRLGERIRATRGYSVGC
jgi:hypothetical protein